MLKERNRSNLLSCEFYPGFHPKAPGNYSTYANPWHLPYLIPPGKLEKGMQGGMKRLNMAQKTKKSPWRGGKGLVTSSRTNQPHCFPDSIWTYRPPNYGAGECHVPRNPHDGHWGWKPEGLQGVVWVTGEKWERHFSILLLICWWLRERCKSRRTVVMVDNTKPVPR